MVNIGDPKDKLSEQDKTFVAPDNSRKQNLEPEQIAQALFDRHKSEILEPWNKFEEPDGFEMPNQAIAVNLDEIPQSVLKQYWGHGITKGTEMQQLAALISIAQKKTIKSWCGPLGTGQFSAYDNGAFLIISPKGQNLQKKRS